MADSEKQITRAAWNAEAAQVLAPAMGKDAELIRNEVEAGVSMLWRCRSGGAAAWVVTRDEGEDFVIVAGAGSGFRIFAPEFVAAAHRKGRVIRTHVTRPGLIRLWQRLGVTFDHYVLRG